MLHSGPRTTQQITADHVQLQTVAVSTQERNYVDVRDMEQGSSQIIRNANYAGALSPGTPIDIFAPPPRYEQAVYTQKSFLDRVNVYGSD